MRNLKEGIEIIPTATDGGGNVETIQGDLLAPEEGIHAATIDVKVREAEITDQEEAVNKGGEAVTGGGSGRRSRANRGGRKGRGWGGGPRSSPRA